MQDLMLCTNPNIWSPGGHDSLDSAICLQGMVEAGAEGVQGLQRQVAALQQSSEEGLRRQGADLGDRLQELHHHYHRQQDLLQVSTPPPPPPLLPTPLTPYSAPAA